MLESEQSALGIFQAELCGAEPEVGIQVRGIERTRLVEGLRGLVPRADALQADREIEPAFGELRLELGECAVALGGFLVIAQFELNVAHRAVDFRRCLIGGYGALQLLEGVVALAGQVQAHGTSQESGCRTWIAARQTGLVATFQMCWPEGLNFGGSDSAGTHCLRFSFVGIPAGVSLTQ